MTSVSNAPGPDFICVGAQKGGTRWLYDQLADHPAFWMPPIKELHYFDRDGPSGAAKAIKRATKRLAKQGKSTRRRAGGRDDAVDARFLAKYIDAMQADRDVDRYAELFADKGERLVGDVTPGYSSLDVTWIDAMQRRFPATRIIFIAREPVDRLWSQYCMALRYGSAKASTDPEEILAFANRSFVASRSFPSEIVGRWRARFPQFGLFFFDDLKADPVNLRYRILEFLGAHPGQENRDMAPDFNRKGKLAKTEMSDEVRAVLVDHFAVELERCADELGGPAAGWRDRTSG